MEEDSDPKITMKHYKNSLFALQGCVKTQRFLVINVETYVKK